MSMDKQQLPLHVAIPYGSIYGTRTSDRWKNEPGQLDSLNLEYIFPHVGKWGIPALKATQFVPSMLAAWHDPGGREHAAHHAGCIHFFLDDYRFERIWNRADVLHRPKAARECVCAERIWKRPDYLDWPTYVGACLTPDFSVWGNMPIAAQVWQIYRARWIGAWWQYNGIEVIPTVTWGDPDTYDFVFEGLPEGGTIAVATVGVRDTEAQEKFAEGLEVAVKRLCPTTLLVYGRLGKSCEWLNLPEVREYQTFGEQLIERVKAKQSGGTSWVDEDQQAEEPLWSNAELGLPDESPVQGCEPPLLVGVQETFDLGIP